MVDMPSVTPRVRSIYSPATIMMKLSRNPNPRQKKLTFQIVPGAENHNFFKFILNLMKKSKKQTLGGSKSESILGWLGHPEFQKSNSASVSYFRRSKIVMFMRHWLIWSIIDCTESSEDNEAVNFKVKKINNFCWTTYEVIITFNCTAKILVLQDKK